jgi:hypothetical protein
MNCPSANLLHFLPATWLVISLTPISFLRRLPSTDTRLRLAFVVHGAMNIEDWRKASAEHLRLKPRNSSVIRKPENCARVRAIRKYTLKTSNSSALVFLTGHTPRNRPYIRIRLQASKKGLQTSDLVQIADLSLLPASLVQSVLTTLWFGPWPQSAG